MTIPYERYRNLMQARELLKNLVDPKSTPGVSADIRRRARALLKHFPTSADMQEVLDKCPELWQAEF